MTMNTKKIMYIEDEEANRVLVRKLLRAAGYEVLMAEDGLSGIDLAKESQPALILMDMNMPGLDGYEASTRIKAINSLREIPIIAVTANVQKGDRERSLVAGCDGYITKPIDPDTFIKEIESYLEGQREVLTAEEEASLLREYSDKLVVRLEQKVRDLSTDKMLLEQRVSEKIKEVEAIQGQLLQSEKLASIGQLAAGVAHEINNPIGFINSNLGSLRQYVTDLLELITVYSSMEQTITDTGILEKIKTIKNNIEFDYLRDDVKELLSESIDGIDRVKKIINDLKDFSRVDTTETEWADLHNGIDSTLNMVHNEIKYNAKVVKEYGDLPDVKCVVAQLNQVFMNLLVNAAHAIDEQGTITIRTGTESDDKVWIQISDTGKGISEENIKKIFDPFFTTKPVGKGTGLGLSLSYGIIGKHGGTFDVQSEVGKGTSFTVHLPIHKVETLDQDGEKMA